VRGKDGNITGSVEDQLHSWAEHFSQLQNNHEQTDQDLEPINTLPLRINKAPATWKEIIKATKSLKNGKAAGQDRIRTDVLKAEISPTGKEKKKKRGGGGGWKIGLAIQIPQTWECRFVRSGEELACYLQLAKYLPQSC
jgi:hypothetical protein